MRGADRQTAAMFSYISPEGLVPQNHPLRAIRLLVNAALERLSGRFEQMYAPRGRDSIAPEKLLRALLLQALFSVRSERQLVEQITYNMMFRWFVGLSMDAPVWDVTVFTKNRDRLLAGDIARSFLAAILIDPKVKPLLSDEHFSVDGTLIEAWASMKSFRPKDGSGEPPTSGRNGEVDFRGEPRGNDTHASTTDPDARLYKKAAGQAAKLCHMGHGGAGGRHRHGRGVAGRRAHHPRHGQELRHAGVRRRDAPAGRDAARHAEQQEAPLPHRRPHHAPCWLRGQPARPQADRGGVRLDEDDGRPAQDPAPWHRAGRLDVHLRHGRLQPRAPAEAAGGNRVVMPGLCPEL